MSSATIAVSPAAQEVPPLEGGPLELDRDVMIRVEDVRKHYDDGRIKALDGISLDVLAGEFLAIVGPSGSGKSTLLHMLGALDVPDSGRVTVEGTDIAGEKDLATFRRHTVGFVFQLHNLIPTLTAWENVQMALLEERMTARERKRRAVALLEKLGLANRIDSLPPKLSGGERQRVAIARALVCDPRILIADEPTGAVDSANSAAIVELLRELGRERGLTVVVVTHDPDVASQADRRVRILDGRLVK
jgi:putative ABC transport system ATP-binding protein